VRSLSQQPAAHADWFSGSLGERATVHLQPFRWIETADVFRPDLAARLSASFPVDGMAHFEAPGGPDQKAYSMRSRTLVEGNSGPRSGAPGRPRPEDAASPLPPLWSEVAGVLCGSFYRDTLSQLANTDLSRCTAHIRICSYGPGHWLGPHTDRPDKLATHIIYLTPGWLPEWGGALRLHRSQAADDVAAVIAPAANSGVLLVRSDRSWHSVESVREGAPHRRSILVHFEAR
jgi:SM-20-related protein